MDLLIDTFGSKIRKQREQIVVEVPNEKSPHMYPARRLDRILIMGSSSISSDAVQLAMKHGVDISYIGQFGKPEARIVPSAPTGSTKVRHAQLRVAFTGDAFCYAREFVYGKMRNQLIIATRARIDPSILLEMRHAIERAMEAADIGTLMAAEGHAAARYFSAAWGHVFGHYGRDQQGHDRVNAALNYGYGILYNEIERAALFAGLDPFIGMLHSERYGKPSLVLDLIEEFRVTAVDTSLLPLFEEEKFTQRDFIEINGRQTITQYGRRKIVQAIFTRLNTPVFWKGAQRKLKDAIAFQSQELARAIVKEIPEYFPFITPPSFYEKPTISNNDLVEKPEPAPLP
jgi:CRISP-associated protein Cas1